jgi:mono/diheme cytochrome c family protein
MTPMILRGRGIPSLLVAAALAACGGGDDRTADTAGATAAAPAAQAPGGGAAVDPSSITPQMTALGDSIFHGLAANGTCTTCHGPDAKGTTLAPDLTDAQWLNTDGSYQGITDVVTNGVPTPKQFPAAMPPMGGIQLTPEQIRAVSAYVYSLRPRTG